MSDEKKVFQNAMSTAIIESAKTGSPYYVMFPYIANPGSRESCHLIMGVVHKDALAPDSVEDGEVAFTVFPDGTILFGKAELTTKKYKSK